MTRCEAVPSGARGAGRSRAASAAREIAGGLVVLAVYLTFTHVFAGPRAVSDAHGRSLLALERWLHVDVGHRFNGVLIRHGWLGALAAWEYATTYVLATFGFLGYLWWRRSPVYPWARNTLIWITLIAICCFAAWPSTPPRLLPGEGYTDIIALHHPPATWGSGVVSAGADPYAAMPSLHIGWVAWIGVAAVRARCGAAVAWLCGLHLVVTSLVIVATAAHYVVDIPGGLLLVPAAAGAEALRAGLVRSRRARRDADAAPPDGRRTRGAPSAASTAGREAPQVVGAVAEFAGAGPSAERVRAVLAERLPGLPRLTRRPRLGGPAGPRRRPGRDQAEIDLSRHVLEVDLPAPGGRRELDDLVARLIAEPFHPGRPPWRLHLVRGGGSRPDAVVLQLHRALADGARPLDVLRDVLDPPPGTGGPGRRAAMPAPARPHTAFPAPPSVAVPSGGAAPLGVAVPPGVPAPLSGAVPPGAGAPVAARGFATTALPLDLVRDVARAAGVRVSELLAALAGDAAAEAIPARAAGPPDTWSLRVAVPAPPPAVPAPPLTGPRSRERAVGRGELAGARWLDVPVDGRPLRERLTEIRHIGDEHRPGPGHRPDGAQSAIVANVSGPPGELVLAGMPLDGVHPILAPFGGVPIAVCALGRRGSLHVSVTADIGVLPDAGRFAAGLRRALDKLAAEFGADAGPGRSGAQTGTT